MTLLDPKDKTYLETYLLKQRQSQSLFHVCLERFIKESNEIEYITRAPNRKDFDAFYSFLGLKGVTISDLKDFVAASQPDAELRDKTGLDVRVGSYIAPPGGKQIVADLQELLECANEEVNRYTPIDQAAIFKTHVKYERLHPFTDGNGRSGRVLWLWMMLHSQAEIPRSFLKSWYYQSFQ